MSLLNQRRGVEGPGKVVGDADTQEFEAGDPFYLNSIDVDGSVSDHLGSPEVHNEFLGLIGVQLQTVVGEPTHQVLDLLPIGRLIIVPDETHHRRVVRKLNDGVGAMYRGEVIGEQREEKGAQHTALWDPSVQG